MRILQEGDKERALHPDLGRLVEVVYQRRRFYYQPEDVHVVALVGVYPETDEALVIPPQSEPDIGAAIKAKNADNPAPPQQRI